MTRRFIGSNIVDHVVGPANHHLTVLAKPTYAGHWRCGKAIHANVIPKRGLVETHE